MQAAGPELPHKGRGPAPPARPPAPRGPVPQPSGAPLWGRPRPRARAPARGAATRHCATAEAGPRRGPGAYLRRGAGPGGQEQPPKLARLRLRRRSELRPGQAAERRAGAEERRRKAARPEQPKLERRQAAPTERRAPPTGPSPRPPGGGREAGRGKRGRP